MGIPVSLSPGELSVLAGLAITAVLVAIFVALFVSAVIGVGIVRLLYLVGSWSVRRIHASYPVPDARERAASVGGTRMTSARPSAVHL